MKRFAILVSILLAALCVQAFAVEVTPPDGQVAAGAYFQVKISGVAQADLTKSHVIYFPRDGVEVTPLLTWDGTPLLWCRCTKAGNYLFAVSSGGEYAETVLTIGGTDNDDNDGDDDPLPLPSKRFVMILGETSARTAAQAAVIAKVQAYCREKSHPWRVEDPDQTGEWIGQWKAAIDKAGQKPPVLIVAAIRDDGTTADSWVAPLPAKPADAIAFIQSHGG